MKTKHIAHLFQDNAHTIHVRFDSHGRLYTYLADKVEGVEVDDYVVVDTPLDGLKVVKVEKVDEHADIDLDAAFSYKWIVQRINVEAYNERCKREAEFALKMAEVERKAQRERVRQCLIEEMGGTQAIEELFDGAVKSLNQKIEEEDDSN